jgi:hypothetical protein
MHSLNLICSSIQIANIDGHNREAIAAATGMHTILTC